MELYNTILQRAEALTAGLAPRRFAYDPAACWPETAGFTLVMGRDTAFELGGSHPTANLTAVTSTQGIIPEDEILLYGPDLTERNESMPYVRLALVEADGFPEGPESDPDRLCKALQDIDFVKYHVFPEGCMLRSSALECTEQVRLSKAALQKGISFAAIGNMFLKHYHKNPQVKHVRLVFITAGEADYAAWKTLAKDTAAITRALTQIAKGMETDCHTCSMKPICDEVEGMKELHFQNRGH